MSNQTSKIHWKFPVKDKSFILLQLEFVSLRELSQKSHYLEKVHLDRITEHVYSQFSWVFEAFLGLLGTGKCHLHLDCLSQEGYRHMQLSFPHNQMKSITQVTSLSYQRQIINKVKSCFQTNTQLFQSNMLLLHDLGTATADHNTVAVADNLLKGSLLSSQ